MKRVILPILLMFLPMLAYSSIEGIYQVQPDSYRSSSEMKTYGKPFEIMIFNNGDGTYYVDDLLGGWYCQREGYGRNYSMTGNIEISEDGNVSLKDSYIKGWDDGLDNFSGIYNAATSTFNIQAYYANGLCFVQTWVKIDDFHSGGDTNIEKDGIYYKIDSQEKKAGVAFNPNFYEGDIIIPEKIEYDGVEYNVTEISDSAFYLCRNLLSLEIPNSITTIGSSSFNGCESLASIIIPNSVTGIGDYAFYGCMNLASVGFPNQLKSIGNSVFRKCQSLKSIEIPNSVTSIGDFAFSGCFISSLYLTGNIVSIGKQAFEGNSFAKLSIPNGVVIIGDEAFMNCIYLTTIDIPSSVASIGHNAFSGFELASINIENLSAWCKADVKSELFTPDIHLYLNGSEIRDLVIPADVKKVKKHNFEGCPSIVSVTIPSGVTEIADSAFLNCTNLQTVTIQSPIDSIAKYTFYKCASLESVKLPNDIESIGEEAFFECGKLKSFSLPAKLKSIGNNAFENCKELSELKFPDKLTTIGDKAFWGCNELKSLYIPATLTSIGNAAFSSCEGLTSITVDNGNMVYDSRYDCNAIIETATNTLLIGCNNSTIPNSIQFIGGSAFQNCKELKTIKIPETVKEIGGSAFAYSGLTTIEIPNSVTTIGGNAFSGTELTSIDIPNSVTWILSEAFSYCASLTSVHLPDQITSIERFTFFNCSSLTSAVIPDHVTSIGEHAFEGCAKLTAINFPNSVKSIGGWAFFNCHSLKSISFSNNLTNVGDNAFRWCLSLDCIKIPNSLDRVEDDWFYGCKGLKKIYMPETMSYIEKNAFINSPDLEDVYCYANEAPSLGSSVFLYPERATLHVPSGSIEKYKKAYGWKYMGKIVALTDEELAIYGDDIPQNALSNSIEGIYMTQPDSYCLNKGNKQTYGNSCEIIIVDNGDGSYYVDDLWGGWYRGYGPNYSMTGNIAITPNGIVSLKDSYVKGWGDSLAGLNGTYDSEKKTFTIEAYYLEDLHFYQTWVKVGDIFTVDGITYSMTGNNTVSVWRGKEPYSGNINIPEKVSNNGETYTVTSLGTAFRGCENLKSVIIPKTVTSINGAFSRCTGLTSVTIPDGVTSISGAFYECTSLKSIIIPNGVTTLDNSEFWGCTSLETVVIPNSVTTIAEWAFLGCTSLSSITVPSSVVSIGEGAFSECVNLADLTLSDGLLTIGNNAFSWSCGPKSLTIPKSVIRIGKLAFTMCEDIESIRVDKDNVKYDSRGNCNAIIETYKNRLILGCKNTVIPQDVAIIGNSAFSGCYGLKSFDIPGSVTEIETCAFYQCTGLSSINLDNNIREIGTSAFSGCNRVKTVIIPHNINAVNWRTFEHCYDLRDFYCYADTYPATDKEAFFETPIENATLHVPANLIDKYRYTAPWSGFGKIVALTDNDPKPTSVRTPKADETVTPVATYSIDGRRLSQPQRGLNIIRMSDGTTKKVMIK